MSAKAKAIALLLVMDVTLGACAPEVRLPRLWEAPDFALINQDSREVKLSDFRGEVVLMDFIYTSCPDVCGLLDYQMQRVWHQLDDGLKQDLVLISVSFDPEVDTPEVLRQYATLFDVPGWQFLTGTLKQIHQVTDDYGLGYQISYEETADEPDHKHGDSHGPARHYRHNIVVVLIDRDGMVRKTYGNDPASEVEKTMIRDVTSVVGES